jgi:photosystem II stability/assembly factor-like uncharacterized protein
MVMTFAALFLLAVEGEFTLQHPRCAVRDGAYAAGTVWLLCDTGEVYLSGDQGKTWTPSRVPQPFKQRAIAALDAQRGALVGDYGNVWLTADRGKSWQKAEVGVDATLTDIQLLGEQGWIAGYSGVILHTADAGKTWTRQPTMGSASFEAISFADSAHGIAVGWAGAIARTTDGGATWEAIKSPAALWSFNSVFMRDANTAWAVGMSGQLMSTRDGGKTWASQKLDLAGSLTSVFFDKQSRGWITSDRDIFFTTGGGQTWTPSGLNDWVFLTEILEVGDSLWALSPQRILRKEDKSWEPLRTWFRD